MIYCRNSFLQAVRDTPVARITGCVSVLGIQVGAEYAFAIVVFIEKITFGDFFRGWLMFYAPVDFGSHAFALL